MNIDYLRWQRIGERSMQVDGELDAHSITFVEEELDRLAHQPTSTVYLDGVTFVDSAAVMSLGSAVDLAASLGHTMHLRAHDASPVHHYLAVLARAGVRLPAEVDLADATPPWLDQLGCLVPHRRSAG